MLLLASLVVVAAAAANHFNRRTWIHVMDTAAAERGTRLVFRGFPTHAIASCPATRGSSPNLLIPATLQKPHQLHAQHYVYVTSVPTSRFGWLLKSCFVCSGLRVRALTL
jgi:hypothetical protein